MLMVGSDKLKGLRQIQNGVINGGTFNIVRKSKRIQKIKESSIDSDTF